MGKASAELIAIAGAKVVLAARNKEKAKAKESNDSGGEAYVIEVDVTDLAGISSIAREVNDDMGKIDVLVNAFGTVLIQPILDIKPDHA